MTVDLNYFHKKLEEEREALERQLKMIAKRNPENPKNWMPIQPDLNTQQSEASEMADLFEEFENTAGREVALELRLNEVNAALKKIEAGTYGLCETDQKPISPERLEADPAAKTCVEHSKN
ncbi:MAG: hypothetical protein AAB474_00225 [Patescibacteria group bacterium]